MEEKMHTVKQIEKMEIELGKIKKINLGLLGLILAALSLITLGASNEQEKPTEIRSKKIVLEDDSGKERSVFTASEKGVEIKLLGADGKQQVILYVDDTGSGIYLTDLNGVERIGLRTKPNDVQIAVSDSAARQRLQMLVRDNQPSLILADITGKERIALKTDRTDPLISITDANGNARLRLGMRDDFPNLTLSGAGGEPFWAAIPDKYKE